MGEGGFKSAVGTLSNAPPLIVLPFATWRNLSYLPILLRSRGHIERVSATPSAAQMVPHERHYVDQNTKGTSLGFVPRTEASLGTSSGARSSARAPFGAAGGAVAGQIRPSGAAAAPL